MESFDPAALFCTFNFTCYNVHILKPLKSQPTLDLFFQPWAYYSNPGPIIPTLELFFPTLDLFFPTLDQFFQPWTYFSNPGPIIPTLDLFFPTLDLFFQPWTYFSSFPMIWIMKDYSLSRSKILPKISAVIKGKLSCLKLT